MSNENINNDDEEIKTKTTLSPKEQESNKNTNNLNSPEKNSKITFKRRFSNLYNQRPSMLTEDSTESNNIERMKKDLKRGLTKRVPNSKRKKGKKSKKT